MIILFIAIIFSYNKNNLDFTKKEVALQPNNFLIYLNIMLIVDTKNSENIDKALRKYKKKFDKAHVILQLREREFFMKPSVRKRNQRLKAIYRQKMMIAEV